MSNLFPFDNHRESQDRFMKVVETALEHKKDVLAEVPTGVGKTAAVLTPALEYAIKHNKKVLFLTSKHTHHNIAIDTLKKIKNKHNIKLQVADFIGKVWMCARQEIDPRNASNFRDYCKHLIENKDCKYYENFHNKSNFFSNKLLTDNLKKNLYHVEELINECRNANVCPYEAANKLAKEAKVVIADYFQMLDSGIRQAFLKKLNVEIEDCIIIWDEAHNLPSRARSLLSDTLTELGLERCLNESVKFNLGLDESVLEIRNKLGKLMDKYNGNEVLIRKEEFGDIHEDFIEDLREASEEVLEKQPLSSLRSLANFLQLWNVDGREYSRILSKKKTRLGKDIISLEKNCLDPAVIMKDVVEGAHSNIFMSGTLYPLDMYENIFNLKFPMKLDFQNPYPKENRLDLVLPLISTKYSMRSEEMYERIAKHCRNLVNEIKGNKIFFFPSYDMLARIRVFFDNEIIVEEQGMDKQTKEALLNRFRMSSNNVLFAVSAGSFGEGVNLEGDALSGVVIVGIPFAKFDLISKELTRYYDEKFNKGQDYGYVLPAFTKVLQNAGRCIRSEKDKGVIVYLDERYAWNNYTKYFPSSIKLKRSDNYELIRTFFSD